MNMDMSQFVRPRVISGSRVEVLRFGGFDLEVVGAVLTTFV